MARSKSRFTNRGRLEEECVNLLVDQLSISGEFISTFKTKSYVEMWKKANLGIKSLNRLGSSSSSSSSFRSPVHLCDNLLEPQQETLLEMTESYDLHPLVVDFVNATFEASKICELLIRSVVQVRANYRIIQRVIRLAKNTLSQLYETRSSVSKRLIRMNQIRQTNYSRLSSYRRAKSTLRREDINHEEIESLTYTDYTDDQCHAILKDLASFAMLNNPLVSISPSEFHDMHDSQEYLLRNLSMKCRKVKRRRAKFTIYCKKAVVLACSLELVHKGKKMTKRRRKISSLERLVAQLEVARKGVYFLKYDFDMLSPLVRRLEDGIERIKDLSDVCVRCGKIGVVKVVRELGMDQRGFLEKLEELERQIILCFLDINRSRKKLLHEIMVLQQDHR